MNVRKTLLGLLALLLISLAAPALRADPCDPSLDPTNPYACSINVSYSQADQSVVQGTTQVAFSATVTNTTGALLNLNSDTSNINPPITPTISTDPNCPGLVLVCDYAFLSNLQLYSLSGGQSVGPVELFYVNLPSNLAVGTYSGFFSFLGGPTNEFDNLGTGDFSITVTNLVTTPEPGILPMLLVGIALAGAYSLLKLRFA
jgi:hypothetical protein